MNNEFMSAIAGKREEGGRGGLELWVGPGRAGKFGSNYTWNNLDLDRVTAVPVTRTTPAADTWNRQANKQAITVAQLQTLHKPKESV